MGTGRRYTAWGTQAEALWTSTFGCCSLTLVAVVVGVTIARLTFGAQSPGAAPSAPGGHPSDSAAQDAVQSVMEDLTNQHGVVVAKSYSGSSMADEVRSDPGYSLRAGPASGENVISVNPCADGPSCRELELAVQPNPVATCWLGRTELINLPNGLITATWSFGWTPRAKVCSSGSPGVATVPESGWQESYPIPSP
jgi:hypothetical protein